MIMNANIGTNKKKALNYYMSLTYKKEIIPDEDEGGYTVSFPDLPGCLTCVENINDIESMAEDAKRVWIISALEEGLSIKE